MEQNRMDQSGTEESNIVKTRAQLKAYFESGDYPTESQFAELIDNLVHLDELNALEKQTENLKEYCAQLEECCSKSKDYPIVKVKEGVLSEPNLGKILTYANQFALNSGLIIGDLFWMQAEGLVNNASVLMRVNDPN